MKVVIVVLLAGGLGFGFAWFIKTRQHAEQRGEQSGSESELKAENAYLRQALADAKKGATEIRTLTRTVTTTVTNRLSATDVLETLIRLNPNVGEESRNRTLRQIVYHLQLLAEIGPEALPVIHDFLSQNKDVDYTSYVVNASGQRVSRTGSSSFTIRNLASTDFLVPPSLRLGLADVLAQIGGEHAESILAQVLDTTGRGVEVAYIARVLQDIFPGKYRENALRAAKDLLTNPPPVSSPNRLDDNAKAYLYQVLTMYNDTTFFQQAQTQIVTAEGQVDRQALGFVTSAMKENAVPALYNAYQDSKLTNQIERGLILNALLSFTGPSTQANGVFNQVINDESLPAGVRVLTIQGLAGGSSKEPPTDPRIIQSRMDVLREVRRSMRDERLLRAIDETSAQLQTLLTGVPR